MEPTTSATSITGSAAHRRRTGAAAIALAATGAMVTIAIAGLSTATVDGRPVVLAATAIGGAAGLVAAWMITMGRVRMAGALLVASIVTPTYAAAPINLVPLLLGIVLLVDSFRADPVFADPPR